tara:strand:+ start:744 stop:1136 length:393 start_codon:yes stop_codon:yes gene_type:complete
MADEIYDRLHLNLMQGFLPVSLAMIERLRRGGPSEALEVFSSSHNPLQDLQNEGESSAKVIRDRLDEINPGLGNPVMPVSVEVTSNTNNSQEDSDNLRQVLIKIESRLDQLQTLLDDTSEDSSKFEVQDG